MPKSSIEKNFSKKLPLIVITTIEAPNNFDIEKWHFLTGLDTPNTPSTLEMGVKGKYFEQLSPKVEKSEILLCLFFQQW